MILVMGELEEPMIEDVLNELERRGAPVRFISAQEMPGEVSLSVALPGTGSCLRWSDGTTLPLEKVRSIYHRLGFSSFQGLQDYSAAEDAFVSSECMGALTPVLNALPAQGTRVVNPPLASGTNASKPYQTSLIQEIGFSIPETLVTNDAEAAVEFFDRHEGQVIYKSISYVRSIVKQMTAEDLQRLDTLQTCPIQLQEMVAGIDYRVHVIGDQVFAHKILASDADYRYDKQAQITAYELEPATRQRCIQVARRLGMEIAGVDLRRTPAGQAYCFEVNPSPAFSWYEVRTGQPITESLCDLLLQPL